MSDYDDHFMTVNVREMHRFTYCCACVAKKLSYEIRSFDTEKNIVAGTLKMFIVEKLQSYKSMIKSEFSEEAVINEIEEIIAAAFSLR